MSHEIKAFNGKMDQVYLTTSVNGGESTDIAISDFDNGERLSLIVQQDRNTIMSGVLEWHEAELLLSALSLALASYGVKIKVSGREGKDANQNAKPV